MQRASSFAKDAGVEHRDKRATVAMESFMFGG
jgi:hypothetical protein